MRIIPFILLCALCAFSSFAQQTNCLTPGAVSWWRAEGNANDATGGNSGTWAGSEAYAPGEVGQGFNFNGAQGIHVADAPNLRFTNAMTFEAWIYARNPARGSVQGILLKWEGGFNQHSYTITIEADGRFATSLSGDGGPSLLGQVFSAQKMPTNTWTHVATAYNGAFLTLYINGQLNSASSWTNGIFAGPAGLDMGYNPAAAFAFFDGILDEPALYNRALSASEIQTIYNAGTTGKRGLPVISKQPQNQVAFWGQSATFSVMAIGSESLAYQWVKNGVEIVGATNSSLVLTNLQASDAGSYFVSVANSCGSTNSSNAHLTVNPAGVSIALYAGITINGVAGLTYGIQYNTDLNNTNGWQGIANVTLSIPTGFWLDVQPATWPQRYYRVVPGPISIP